MRYTWILPLLLAALLTCAVLASCSADDDDDDSTHDDDDDTQQDDDDDDDDDDDLPGLPDGWTEVLVDSPGAWDPRLALDSQDHIHISYYQSTDLKFIDSKMRYATNAGGDWAPETAIDFERLGYNQSMALGGQGDVHLAMHEVVDYEEVFDTLTYAVRHGGTWSTERLDNGRQMAYGSGITADSEGGLQIIYAQGNENDNSNQVELFYIAKEQGSSWGEPQWIDHGSVPAAILDQADELHAFYFANFESWDKEPDPDPISQPGDLVHLSGSPGDWQGEAIDRLEDNETPEWGFEPWFFTGISPDVDSAGALHVLYSLVFCDYEDDESYIYKVKYATNAQGQWIDETLCEHCYADSLAVDVDDRVHIVYSGTDPCQIIYLNGSMGDWQTLPLGVDYAFPSIDIDAQGYAHIATVEYIHPHAHELYYITNSP